MHGDAVRQLQIVHIPALVGGDALVVKLHLDGALLRVDGRDEADVAVEDALSLLPGEHALLLPFELIVVARLHHLVALTEGRVAANALVFVGSGRVELRLQHLVEHPHAAVALFGRGEHLHLLHRVKAKEVRQARRAEAHDLSGGVRRRGGALKEEIAALRVQPRRLAVVDAVRVVDDHALFVLAEDLRQLHRRDGAAVQDIAQHVARAHAGQLIAVADHDQPRARHQCAQYAAHQEDVDHRHLVDDQRVHLQRIVLSAGKVTLLAAVLEQPVQRLGLHAAGLAHALGGAARRRGERDLAAHAQQPDDALDDRRLARARAAGDHRHAA